MRPALAAVAVLVVAVPGAHGAAPVPGGLIVFESARNGESELFTVRADGTGLRRITRSFPPAEEVAWSPNGRAIAFSRSSSGGPYDIWMAVADGSRPPRRLTAPPDRHCDGSPAWSSDGRRIAFHRDTCGFGGNELWVMRADGTQQRRVLTLPRRVTGGDTIDDLAWSSRGDLLVNGRGACRLLVRADGTNVRFLCGSGAEVFSPDGRRVAFIHGSSERSVVYTSRLDGSDSRRVGPAFANAYHLDWSRTGAFAVVTAGRKGGIQTFSTGSPRPRRLVSRASAEGDILSPAWSPNGRMLAYIRDGALRVVDADGRRERALAPFGPARSPAWTPDGRSIVYSRSIGRDHAMVVGADGGNAHVLLTRPNGVREPRMSPEGRAIAYVYDGGRFGYPRIAVRRLPSGPTRTIAEYARSPEWSPGGKRLAYVDIDVDHDREDSSIWTVGADGSDRKRLTSETDRVAAPVWSPDGRYITYAQAPDVWVMEDDGANKRVLVRNGSTPAWSRDGREVVFTRGRALMAVDVATGTERTILSEGGANARWQPLPR